MDYIRSMGTLPSLVYHFATTCRFYLLSGMDLLRGNQEKVLIILAVEKDILCLRRKNTGKYRT